MTRRRAAIWIAGAVILLAASGCIDVSVNAGPRVDVDQAEEQFRRQFARQTGSDIRTVECPDSVEPEKYSVFECEAHGADGTSATIRVTQKDDEGNVHASAPRLLHTGRLEPQIRDVIAARTRATNEVSCPDLLNARGGTRFTCLVRASDGSEAAVDVRVVDEQGKVRWVLRGTSGR